MPQTCSPVPIRLLPLFALAAVFPLAAKAAPPRSRDLNTGWTFRALNANDHPELARPHPAAVPGVVQTDLLTANLIPDPFLGDNEQRLQWIGKTDWEYATEFDANPAQLGRRHIELVFDGLDTFADVTLNGHPLLQADNMFRTWRVDVKPYLQLGANHLIIVFHSPVTHMAPMVAALPYILPGNGFEPSDPAHGIYPVSQYIRKSPYQFGWDWAPSLVTLGIWRAVHLESWDDARIADFAIHQQSITHERALLSADLAVDSDSAQSVDATVRIAAPNHRTRIVRESAIALDPGANHISVPIRIDLPDLWYPNGYGPQSRYAFSVTITAHNAPLAEAHVTTGLRSVELLRKQDQWGTSFTFVVNGIPIFAQGANIVPFDSFPSRVTVAQQRRILEAAHDSNFNMVRLWGGGYYESGGFYDLCDQLGLMVWQEFIFGGAMVPGDDAFQQNVATEAQQQLIRLRNHPSIVLWCGNNEVETGWFSWGDRKRFAAGLTPDQRRRVWQDYVVLFHNILKGAVAQYGNGIPYWPSSPSADLLDIANNPRNGDMHYWNVWSGAALPIEEYRNQTPRFMSEYGFQSMPDLATVRTYAADDEDLASPALADHERYVHGYDRMKTYLAQYFRAPRDFASFVYLSQVLQAEAIKTGAEHLRASQPHTMGSLYWQLNDCWPVASWSSIDYYGRWKALQYYARRFYASVLVAPEFADGKITVRIVSNRQQPFPASLVLRLMDFRGNVLAQRTQSLTVGALTSTLAIELNASDLAGFDPSTTFIVADLTNTADSRPVARNFLYFARPIALTLPTAHLHATIARRGSGYVVRITTDVLARDVALSFGNLDAHPADNFFDLLPNEPATIPVTTTASLRQLNASFQVVSLSDATADTGPR